MGKGHNRNALSGRWFNHSPNLFPSRQGHQAPEGFCQHSAPGPALRPSTCPGKAASLDPRPCAGQSHLWVCLCCFAEGQSCLPFPRELPTKTPSSVSLSFPVSPVSSREVWSLLRASRTRLECRLAPFWNHWVARTQAEVQKPLGGH